MVPGDQHDTVPAADVRRPRGRRLGPAAVALLLALFTLGLVTGTGSARLGRVAAGLTTTTAATATSAAETAAANTTAVDTTTADTTTAETVTSTQETTTTEAAPVTTTSVQATTIGATTTGAGISAGGAAVVGAKAASSEQESSTQWGWIAFGILAAAVIVFGIVWSCGDLGRPDRSCPGSWNAADALSAHRQERAPHARRLRTCSEAPRARSSRFRLVEYLPGQVPVR